MSGIPADHPRRVLQVLPEGTGVETVRRTGKAHYWFSQIGKENNKIDNNHDVLYVAPCIYVCRSVQGGFRRIW